MCRGSGRAASDLCATGTVALAHVAGSSLLAVTARRPEGLMGSRGTVLILHLPVEMAPLPQTLPTLPDPQTAQGGKYD